jgi:hypothetical protein
MSLSKQTIAVLRSELADEIRDHVASIVRIGSRIGRLELLPEAQLATFLHHLAQANRIMRRVAGELADGKVKTPDLAPESSEKNERWTSKLEPRLLK